MDKLSPELKIIIPSYLTNKKYKYKYYKYKHKYLKLKPIIYNVMSK